MQSQFDRMCATGKLFRSSMTGQDVWDLYIKSFKEENNKIFRDPNSSEHNCNLCKNFLRRYGNIVAIDDNFDLITIFDVDTDGEYKEPCEALSTALKSKPVSEVFFETLTELNKLPYEKCSDKNTKFKLGIDKNVKRYTAEESAKYGVVKPGEILTFNHFCLYLPKAFVDTSGKSVESLMAEYRDANNVFERAMNDIPLDTLQLVHDLIQQGSLLNGQTHLYKVDQLITLKKQFDSISAPQRGNWCWSASYRLPIAKFKNELIGKLCTELAEGEDLNKACQSWNKLADPINYMKTTAPITKRQIEEAKKFVEDNGYAESFDRRFATIDDIKVSEIKHINVGDGKIKSVSIFDGVKSTSTRHKRSEFDGVEEMHIDKFIQDILPSCSSVEAFLSNKMDGNMVTMTTSNVKDSKPIFKWDNNYSWTFDGNLAGKSQIKDAVREKGGVVDGALRFSIMWAEGDASDNSDLDAWAQEPDGTRIGFSTPYRKDKGVNNRTLMSGQLDIDITQPNNFGNKNIVENIVWIDARKMKDGVTKMWVNQYANRGSKGFRAEIECGDETYSYEYNKPVVGDVHVAEITLKNGVFTVKHLLPETNGSKVLYGLQTNEFHKVNLLCLSPNHWGDNNVGNKHYMFMLDGCVCPNKIRSFHNENLIPELAEHRKVLEVLGTTNMIESDGKQLSGVGFNATVRDEVILKLHGSHKRVVRVKF